MNAVVAPVKPTRPYPPRAKSKGAVLHDLITTTDPKTLG